MGEVNETPIAKNEVVDTLSNDEHISLDLICAATGRKLTLEQKLFASNFTKPTISFSDAGTGKTYATAVGLVHTQTYLKVPGNKICVLSFTREAAKEIRARYDIMTRFTFGLTPASFSTFHSLCNAVLTSAWGRPNITKGHIWQDDIPVLRGYCEKRGMMEVTDVWVKKLLVAIDSMNANFVFDKENLKQMLKFRELNIEPQLFNELRVDWFVYQVMMKKIPQGDIPIHCYYLIKRNKEIARQYSKMFDILIIDEFQDMSVLYLKIVFELAKSVVVIGDMKQQIYAFNGASDSITKEFMKIFPEARTCPLTKSFRCCDELLDAAMKYEMPNKPPISYYSGRGKGGEVVVMSSKRFDFEGLCREIFEMQQNLETMEQRDIMFLARNNLSVMSIIEKLYKEGVQFRTTKFKRVMDIPIFMEMCILLDAIDNDKDPTKVGRALRLFGEFRWKLRDDQIPLLGIIESKDISWLDISYRYRDPYWTQLINLFKQIKRSIEDDVPCTRIFNTLMPVYEQFIIEGNWWRLEFDKEFYINLVAPILAQKSYRVMRAEENDKAAINDTNMKLYTGVRCYTVHSAKGLEADEVYVLDCEDAIIPSKKNLEKYIKKKCYYEAAKMVRNERNLLYVAVTRAKRKCVLLYDNEVSELISIPEKNSFSYLDEIYWNEHTEYFNDETFMALFNYK